MKKIITFLIVTFSFSVFSQSPWTQEKGKYYTQLSFTSIPNYDALFGKPEQQLLRNVTDNTLQFYGEYGLSNKITLILNLPFKIIETGTINNNGLDYIVTSEEGKTNSFGNIEVAIKHNFYKKDWLISGQLSLETNTSYFSENSGIRTGYNTFTFTPLLITGKGFGKSFFQTFIGANIRTNNYSSNFKFGGEYGRKLSERIWLIGFLDIVKSFKNGTIVLPSTNQVTGLYVNNQEYGGFGFKGIYEINNTFGMNAGFGGAFFGNNVAKQVAVTFGIYKKF